MKLLLDEQISPRVAERLNELGVDALAAAADPSLAGSADRRIFAAAQTAGRVFVTYDKRDFYREIRDHAARGADHHGLIVVSVKRLPPGHVGRVARALASFVKSSDHQPSFVAWIPR